MIVSLLDGSYNTLIDCRQSQDFFLQTQLVEELFDFWHGSVRLLKIANITNRALVEQSSLSGVGCTMIEDFDIFEFI